ncbi:hypothetical protein Y032_0223g2669 [Ancylostoma ceylanicum]|uniref:Uncharacterized protein n=2 Tax=Ancylostoma ceylanicum TaxID=53326 RepID=A0A016SHQ4_9BILA|nr:hypothetical protein Y032_0223g2669 [Ancylostoma ceylanicum]
MEIEVSKIHSVGEASVDVRRNEVFEIMVRYGSNGDFQKRKHVGLGIVNALLDKTSVLRWWSWRKSLTSERLPVRFCSRRVIHVSCIHTHMTGANVNKPVRNRNYCTDMALIEACARLRSTGTLISR